MTQDKVKLSPKFGLNLSTLICQSCGEETPIIFGRLRELGNSDIKALKEVEGLCIGCQVSSFFEEIKRRVL